MSLSGLCTFMVSVLLISAVFYFLYVLMKVRNFSSGERYTFLKVSIFAIALLPSLTSHDYFSQNHKATSGLTGAEQRFAPTISTSSFGASNQVAWFALIFAIIYGLYVCYGLIRIFYSVYQIHKIKRASYLVPLSRFSKVFVHASVLPPAVVGLFRPVILITESVFHSSTSAQLDLILRHEEIHVERRDNFFNGLRVLLNYVLVFSPFYWLLSRAFEEEMELSCDALVIARDSSCRRSYGSLLAQMAVDEVGHLPLASSSFISSESFVLKRLKSIKENQPMKINTRLFYAVLSTTTVASAISLSALGLENKIKIASPVSRSTQDAAKDYCNQTLCSRDFLAALDRALGGDVNAENEVGERLHFAEGVQQNYAAALEWYLKASALGHPVAPNHIGRIYLNGEGVAKNRFEACKWYAISAERGDKAGQYNASRCQIN